jgi:hypothetical protein
MSPRIEYGYTEMTGGANHSRLTDITYPNGGVLQYVYATGLDTAISRLSELIDAFNGSPGITVEAYSYLGLSTMVRREMPEPEIELTYLKQSGEGNGEAGDQYAGLDRFGRIVDQRWKDSGSSSHIDRFQYGYDHDSNRPPERQLPLLMAA